MIKSSNQVMCVVPREVYTVEEIKWAKGRRGREG